MPPRFLQQWPQQRVACFATDLVDALWKYMLGENHGALLYIVAVAAPTAFWQ
jgi:hypothetical protein